MNKKTLLLIGSIFALTACPSGSSGVDDRFRPFVPDRIGAIGLPACDNYFDQLETCMKKQLSKSQFDEFSLGLIEAKQTIIYMSESEVVYAEQSCQKALLEARQEYAGKCTFN